MTGADVVELSVRELSGLLQNGEITSVELVDEYLRRIAAYDRHGIRLNSVVRLNPGMFDEASASDRRRHAGNGLGVLEGIPFVAKDSYSVAGMPVSAGSPAFANLQAHRDAHAISALRNAGAVFLGLTNMPPMADGGMQRGLYGRAESPYNEYCLTAAYQSGSSNGAATATTSCFAAFGLGEETWSSGRAPASNNSLAAYTPSRGIVSVRGNWPLVPTMDVVVPYARDVADLRIIAEAISAPDEDDRGDFWREQPWIRLPAASLGTPAEGGTGGLNGVRFAVPSMYLNRDVGAAKPIATRATIVELVDGALSAIRSGGGSWEYTDFPVVSNYENDRPGARDMVRRGFVPQEFIEHERRELMAYSWDRFLQLNGDPALNRLADVEGELIFPQSPDSVQFSDQTDVKISDYVEMARQGLVDMDQIPGLADGLAGLEHTREVDFEEWLDALGADAVLLPTVADVGPFDADYNTASNRLAMRNGTWVANGNLAVRHLGIPTVTIPLGLLPDVGMPVGLTIAGKAYSDDKLLELAAALEEAIDALGGAHGRHAPTRLPGFGEVGGLEDGPSLLGRGDSSGRDGGQDLGLAIRSLGAETGPARPDGTLMVTVRALFNMAPSDAWSIRVSVDGRPVPASWVDDSTVEACVELPARDLYHFHSFWRGPYGALATVVGRDLRSGEAVGAFAQTNAVG